MIVARDAEARVVEVARGGAPRSGGAEEASGNQPPVVTAPKRKTIPVRTPFRLTGSATDPDGTHERLLNVATF